MKSIIERGTEGHGFMFRGWVVVSFGYAALYDSDWNRKGRKTPYRMVVRLPSKLLWRVV